MNDFSCRFISEFIFFILTILNVKVIDELMSKHVLKNPPPPKKTQGYYVIGGVSFVDWWQCWVTNQKEMSGERRTKCLKFYESHSHQKLISVKKKKLKAKNESCKKHKMWTFAIIYIIIIFCSHLECQMHVFFSFWKAWCNNKSSLLSHSNKALFM